MMGKSMLTFHEGLDESVFVQDSKWVHGDLQLLAALRQSAGIAGSASKISLGRYQRFAVLPTGAAKTVANQMHDAGLQRGCRIDYDWPIAFRQTIYRR